MESILSRPSTPSEVKEYGVFNGERRVHRGSKEECQRVKRAYLLKMGSMAVDPYSIKPLSQKS
jgi:hypothetical protein